MSTKASSRTSRATRPSTNRILLITEPYSRGAALPLKYVAILRTSRTLPPPKTQETIDRDIRLSLVVARPLEQPTKIDI